MTSSNNTPNNDQNTNDENPSNTPASNIPSEAEMDAEELAAFGAPEVETLESLKADKAKLTGEIQQANLAMQQSDQRRQKLFNELEEAKEVFARKEKNFAEEKKLAAKKFITDLLPVIDDMEMGLQFAQKKAAEDGSEVSKAVVEGFDKTLKKLTTIFAKHNVVAIDPTGQEFNENLHQAVVTANDPAFEDNIVVKVAQKGYMMGDTLIRTATVVVNQR